MICDGCKREQTECFRVYNKLGEPFRYCHTCFERAQNKTLFLNKETMRYEFGD